MKIENIKLLTLLFAASLLSAVNAKSQKRLVDREVICIAPEGDVVNGQGLPLEFEMVDHGPDLRKKNDTILYWLYVTEADGNTWLMYQGSLHGLDTGEAEIGSVSHYAGGYGIKFVYPERDKPYEIDFCVVITTFSLDNNGDTIQYFAHEDPNLANNLCCRKVTILPKSSLGTGRISAGKEAIWTYPNPVNDMLYIRATDDFLAEGFSMSIHDVSGRELMQRQYESDQGGAGTWSVSTSNLSAGVYYLRLQSAKGVFSRKVVIRK